MPQAYTWRPHLKSNCMCTCSTAVAKPCYVFESQSGRCWHRAPCCSLSRARCSRPSSSSFRFRRRRTRRCLTTFWRPPRALAWLLPSYARPPSSTQRSLTSMIFRTAVIKFGLNRPHRALWQSRLLPFSRLHPLREPTCGTVSIEQHDLYVVNPRALTFIMLGSVLGTLALSFILFVVQFTIEGHRLRREARASKARRLRYKTDNEETKAPELPSSSTASAAKFFHTFLSHVWGTGTSLMARPAVYCSADLSRHHEQVKTRCASSNNGCLR